jgi:hypothetical protein
LRHLIPGFLQIDDLGSASKRRNKAIAPYELRALPRIDKLTRDP